MRKLGLKRTMLAGIGLLAIMFTSQVLYSSIVSNLVKSPDSRDAFLDDGVETSANNEAVQLTGTNQVVKYIARNSTAVNVPNTSATSNVTLSAIPATSSVLSSMNGSFKFDNTGFRVNHTIEDDSGYNYYNATSGTMNTTATAASLMIGSTNETGSFKYLNYASMTHPWGIISSSNQVRVDLAYTSVGAITWPASIRIDISLKVQFSRNVTLDVYVYDNQNTNTWIKYNPSTINFRNVDIQTTILNFTDIHSQSLRTSSPCINVSLRFSSTGAFDAWLYMAKAKLFQARTIPIRGNNWVAASFDLRGSATIRGFWFWVRSLNIASSENLQIRLFKTNNTGITLNQIHSTSAISSTSTSFYQQPNMGQEIVAAALTLTNYINDSLNFFNIPDVTLSVGNYFVVLSSNVASGTRYSLVVIPYTDDPVWARDPDLQDDQTVAVSTTGGTSWVEKMVQRVNTTSYVQVDAAPFIVELATRGLIPSDLAMNLTNLPLVDFQMNYTLPFSSSNYEWGRGTWNRVNIGVAASAGNYKLGFTWNSSRMANFLYNATVSMIAYAEDPGATLVKLSRDAPLWKVTYAFTSGKYAGWVGFGINFTFPSDWSVINVTYPDNANYYYAPLLKFIDSNRKEYSVNETSIKALPAGQRNGTYSTSFHSPNYVKSVSSYLKYSSTIFYPAAHFMTGDDMSARIEVQTGSGKAVLNGQVNLSVYSPAESLAFTYTSSVINSTAGFKTSYHFSDAALHLFIGGDLAGRYLARAFWFNGSEVGVYYHEVFKVEYTVSEFTATEMLDEGVDWLSGHLATGSNESINTTIVHVSVDRFNKTALGINISQAIGDIVLEVFNQSETVFNPGEVVQFSVKIKSNAPILPHRIQVNLQVVQAMHPDRVMMNVSLPASVLINSTERINSELTLNLSSTFPVGANGFNAPVRRSLFQTRLNLFVDGTLATTWLSNKTFAVKMDNATDGSVIAVEMVTNRTGKIFSQNFYRANQTIYNHPTMFMVLPESSDGVTMTSYTNAIINFLNSMTSAFENVVIAPVTGDVWAINNIMKIDGELWLENFSLFRNTTNFQVYKREDNVWVPYNNVNGTNTVPIVNGSFSSQFRLPAVHTDSVNVSLNWSGVPSTVQKTSLEITVNLTYYETRCNITVLATEIVVLGDYKNFYQFQVENTGNTTLMFDNYISITNINFRNTTWLTADLLNVAPNESFFFSVVLLADEPGWGKVVNTNFTIVLHAYAVQTKDAVNVTQVFDVSIRSVDLATRLGAIWYLGYFGVIGFLVILLFLLIKNVSKQAKKPVPVGALAKGKLAGKGREMPYVVAKGADLGKDKAATEAADKKYRSIDEVMKEVKGDKEPKTEDSGDEEASDEAEEEESGDEKASNEAEEEESGDEDGGKATDAEKTEEK
nr:hypothetical protein [Candidatus Sigynarchaeota archaeon]